MIFCVFSPFILHPDWVEGDVSQQEHTLSHTHTLQAGRANHAAASAVISLWSSKRRVGRAALVCLHEGRRRRDVAQQFEAKVGQISHHSLGIQRSSSRGAPVCLMFKVKKPSLFTRALSCSFNFWHTPLDCVMCFFGLSLFIVKKKLQARLTLITWKLSCDTKTPLINGYREKTLTLQANSPNAFQSVGLLKISKPRCDWKSRSI